MRSEHGCGYNNRIVTYLLACIFQPEEKCQAIFPNAMSGRIGCRGIVKKI